MISGVALATIADLSVYTQVFLDAMLSYVDIVMSTDSYVVLI